MRRLTAFLAAAAMLAAAPAVASGQTGGQQIPEPGPILTKLGKTPMIELWDGGGGLPFLGASHPYNAGDWEATLEEYHDSGVYEKQIAKVDAVAEHWVRRADRGGARHLTFRRRHRARGVRIVRAAKAGHHDHGQGHGHGHGHGHHHGNNHRKKLAIVFDVDETALSNYSAIVADDFTYGDNSMAEAEDQIGVAIAPTLELYNLAQSKGIETFFVTGRPEHQRADTDENLQREGFTGYKQLYLKPEDFEGTTTDYKAGARTDIEDQGYRIVASVGDQYSDLAGGHEDAAFKLPNPFYFLP